MECRRNKISPMAALLAMALLVSGCGSWSSHAERRPPPLEIVLPPVEESPAQKLKSETTSAAGDAAKTAPQGPAAQGTTAPKVDQKSALPTGKTDGPGGPSYKRAEGASSGAYGAPAVAEESGSKRWPRRSLDAEAAAKVGIRKLVGRRLTLYTDLPSSAEIDELPALFDQAFPQWCEYFGLDANAHAKWNVVGHLVSDKRVFRQTRFMPDDLPPFPSAYCRHDEFWVYQQPTAYYRRHQLLHEGTHAFMYTLLGNCGPAWYREGVAELLATHRLEGGRLTMNYFPVRFEEVPRWGRIKAVQDDVAAGRLRTLRSLMDYEPTAYGGDDMYPWVWAAATFFDGNPRYRERFRSLSAHVNERQFNAQFLRMLGGDMPRVLDDWQVYVSELDFGYDRTRAAIEFGPGKRLAPDGATTEVAADRGWQCSGVRLEAGKTYRLTASGRYQLADVPEIWWSEPNGVSIRYYRGHPLGLLLAAIRPDAAPATSTFLAPQDVGLATTISVKNAGTLYLRINDLPAELKDNAGTARVEIREAVP